MKDTFHKLVIGVAGPSFGVAGSKITTSEWLQILSLTVGIAVGVASFISICFSIRRKYRSFKNERAINPKHSSVYDDEGTTTT